MPRGGATEEARQSAEREAKLAERVKEIAERTDRKPAQVYRQAVREYVEKYDRLDALPGGKARG